MGPRFRLPRPGLVDPREDQLRELLGDRLLSVHRNAAGWRVVTQGIGGDALDTDDADLECAYARALLAAT